MKLIVGLGNPGSEYSKNRHNAGFMAVEKIAEILKVDLKMETRFKAEVGKSNDLLLAKPQTFMNASGQAVSKIKNFYKIDDNDIFLVHDDLDIRLGDYKIQLSTGPKVHNGVDSVELELGTRDFWRVRVGVDNRESRIAGDEYVLSNFSKEEREVLGKVIDKVVEELCKTLKVS